jgi:hypothetical protein
MLYGFRDGNEWVVVAADDSSELSAFADLPEVEEVDALTLMVNDDFRGLNCAFRVGESANVVEIAKVRASDVQRNMRTNDPDYDDIYATRSKEERSIREISGLDKHDPFDNRTDEEKAKDAAFASAIEDHKNKKAGGKEIGGESFSPKTKKGDVGITDVRGTRDASGKVTITDVIAQKGLWDDADAAPTKLVEEPGIYYQVTVVNLMGNTVASLRREFEFAKIEFNPVYESDIAGGEDGGVVDGLSGLDDAVVFWFKTAEEAEDAATNIADMLVHVGKVAIDEVNEYGEPHNPMRIITDTFKKLFRLDVHGIDEARLDEMLAAVPALEVGKMIVQRGSFDEDGSTGVWMASGIQRLAGKIEEALKAIEPQLQTEVYAVNTENERLVPKGTAVVDTEAPREIGPRPWNDRAAEWHAWTDEERAEEIKTNVRGDEFIYAGSHSPVTGSTVYITPLDYFQKTGEMWLEDSLPVAHLLPNDFKEQEPGHYLSYSRDWNTTQFAVGQAGIRDSWFLRIYLNHLER